MLRPAFVACLLAVLVAAPAALADSTRTKILRECQDGRLTGDYTPSQIRDARNNIPDDIDQYSDCRDVLTRALLASAGDSGDGGGGGGGTGGGRSAAAAPAASGGEPLTPSTDADRQALEGAATGGSQPLEVAGRRVTPGEGVAAQRPADDADRRARPARRRGGRPRLAPFVRRSAGRLSALGPMVRRVLPGRSG